MVDRFSYEMMCAIFIDSSTYLKSVARQFQTGKRCWHRGYWQACCGPGWIHNTVDLLSTILLRGIPTIQCLGASCV